MASVFMTLLAAVVVYFGFMYLPVLKHKMSIGDVARETAARMQVDFDEPAMRESVFQQVKARTGVQIGTSEMSLQRQGGTTTVTVKWTEQIKHVWGTNHVMKMQVTESVSPGVHMKNAE